MFEWLESFIRGQSQSVVVGGIQSQWREITTEVPQGSVLGPLLYVLFTADALQIIGEAGVGVQQYADDTQVYQHCKPNDAVRAFTNYKLLSRKFKPGCLQIGWSWTRGVTTIGQGWAKSRGPPSAGGHRVRDSFFSKSMYFVYKIQNSRYNS